MVNTMKRLLLVITILAFAVAILCGCNHESDEKSAASQVSNSQIESSCDSNTESKSSDSAFNPTQSSKKSESDKGNSDKKTDSDYADSKAKDNKDVEINDDIKKSPDKNEDSKDSQPSKNNITATEDVHEAEIDFSELE